MGTDSGGSEHAPSDDSVSRSESFDSSKRGHPCSSGTGGGARSGRRGTFSSDDSGDISSDFVANELWRTADSNGWRASSAPRTYWPPPPIESKSNGYLRVQCNGGLTQQRSAV